MIGLHACNWHVRKKIELNGQEAIFEEIIAGNFPKLKLKGLSQNSGITTTSRMIIPKENTNQKKKKIMVYSKSKTEREKP